MSRLISFSFFVGLVFLEVGQGLAYGLPSALRLGGTILIVVSILATIGARDRS